MTKNNHHFSHLLNYSLSIVYVKFVKIILNYFYKTRFQVDYISLGISHLCFEILIAYFW